MKEVFLALKVRLESILTPDNKQFFKTVDVDSGQIQRIRGDKNTQGEFLFPAVLIKFDLINYENKQANLNLGEARVRMKLAIDNLVHDPVAIFDISSTVNKAVIGGKYTQQELSSITRSFDEQPEFYDNILEWHQYYNVQFYDTSAYLYQDFINFNDPSVNPEAPILYPPFVNEGDLGHPENITLQPKDGGILDIIPAANIVPTIINL